MTEKNKGIQVSVVIPVYNEKENIQKLIEKIEAVQLKVRISGIEGVPMKKEIVIVDDHSTDGTYELLRDDLASKHPAIRLLRHERNRGKGAAIRTGLSAVTGEIVIIQDADLEYDPGDYPKLVAPIADGKADVVYGSRFKHLRAREFCARWFGKRFLGRNYEMSYLHHFIGIQLLNLLANLLYRARITDEATCYKVFRAEVIKGIDLKCEGFEFCPEVTAKARKRGYTIYEVPISYHPRTKAEGKKLRWTHGFKAIWTLVKYRFVN